MARSLRLAVIAAAALAVSAVVATYSMIEVGHQGAKVTWNDVGKEGDGGR